MSYATRHSTDVRSIGRPRGSAVFTSAISALVLAGTLITTTIARAVTDSVTASTPTTLVEPGGPYTSGSYNDVEGASYSFPSFDLLDFNLTGATTTLGGNASSLNSLTIQFTEEPFGSTHPGSLEVFLTNNTSAVSSFSPVLKFDSGNTPYNTATGATTVDSQLAPLVDLGTINYTSTSSTPVGTVDTYSLNFSADSTDIINAINSGSDLRLLIAPNDTTVYATWAGNGWSPATARPTLMFDAVVPGIPYWDVNGSASGLGGTGTWNTTSQTFNDSSGTGTPFVYDSSKLVDFAGTAGTVTLSGTGSPATITENGGLVFDVDGYVLNGDALTVGTTNTISVTYGGTTAKIYSQILGTNGLTKTGAGTLLLDPTSNTTSHATESFSGDVTISAGTLELPKLGILGTASTYGNLVLNGGTLQVNNTDSGNNISLDISHPLIGLGGTLTLPEGVNFTVNGATAADNTGTNSVSLTFTNSVNLNLAYNGTDSSNGVSTGGFNIMYALFFQGSGSSSVTTQTGTLTMNGGEIYNTGAGTVTINGNVAELGSGYTNFKVTQAGAKMVITGGVSSIGYPGFSGAGTFDIQGDNSGLAGANTLSLGGIGSVGPTFNLYSGKHSLGSGAGTVYFDSGTLEGMGSSPISFDALSPGAIEIAAAASDAQMAANPAYASTFGSATNPGAELDFAGSMYVYEDSSNPVRMTVNNTTSFASWNSSPAAGAGGVNPSMVINGISSGHLIINGATANSLPLIVDTLTVDFDGAMSSTPSLQIRNGGRVNLGADALTAGMNLTLGDATLQTGGTLALNGNTQSQTLGTLTVAANSKIDMDHAKTGTLMTISDSHALPWSGLLRISDWNGSLAGNGTDQILISGDGATKTGLSNTQLTTQIHFTSYLTGAKLVTNAGNTSNSEIVPLFSTRLHLGDVNDSGHADAGDILPMEEALTNLTAYQNPYNAVTNPLGNLFGTILDAPDMADVLDVNQDGLINNADLQALVYDLSHSITPTYAVPEPSTLALGLLGAVSLVSLTRKRRRPAA